MAKAYREKTSNKKNIKTQKNLILRKKENHLAYRQYLSTQNKNFNCNKRAPQKEQTIWQVNKHINGTLCN